MKALGMIEVYGYLTAVEALDSALKAANVNLLEVTLVQGGLVTVLVTGDVGATKAAMDASKSAAERVGKVISVHVIPRPSEEIKKMIPPHSLNQSNVKNKEYITPFMECDGDAFETHKESEQNQIDLTQFTSEVLQSMTVENLRKLARELKITNMTNKEIRFGTKNKLIRSISEFIEQER